MVKNAKVDLHVHSKRSYDCFSSITSIISKCKKENIFVAITDHNKICNVKNKRIIVGEEIKSNFGDIIGIFIKEEISGGNWRKIIGEIKKQDGIAILPHPYRGHKNIVTIAKKVDFIELNSRCSVKENILAMKLASKFKKPLIASSDAHLLREICNFHLIVKARNKMEIKEKLLERNYTIVIGKFSTYLEKFLTSRVIKTIKKPNFKELIIAIKRKIGDKK